jgi:hypothetical protein
MVAVTYGSARVAVPAAAAKAQPKTQSKQKGFFARLITAMMDARLRQAQRELELHRHLVLGWDHEPVRNDQLPFSR